MSDIPGKDQPDEQTSKNPPDGRGERPTDPNELAKWIVDQSTSGRETASESSDS